MDIILYLLQLIQYQHKQICWLLNFICRYIPLKQWAFDDSHSPKYQKFRIDRLPKIIYYQKWDYKEYIPYLEWRYGKKIKPVQRRSECDIDDNCTCPRCNAPKPYLYKNNGSKGQLLCKVCSSAFSPPFLFLSSPGSPFLPLFLSFFSLYSSPSLSPWLHSTPPHRFPLTLPLTTPFHFNVQS